MIFLEVENGLVELTQSLFCLDDCTRVESIHGRNWVLTVACDGQIMTVFTGTEPACRAVLGRIIEKLDHVNREVVIRRADYLPETTP